MWPATTSPCANSTWSCRSRAARATSPQSMPSTRTSALEGLHLLLVDIEVGVHVLHVLVLFQHIVQPQHARRALALQLHQVLRNHGNRSLQDRNARRLQ